LPIEIKEKILTFQKTIKDIPIKAKFVEPENLHITLSFLGNIENSKLESLIKEFDLVTKNTEKFDIEIGGLKIIPNENHIRIIGLKAVGGKPLTNFIRSIGTRLNGKFHNKAKITLCRVKNIENKELVKKFIKENCGFVIGKFKVSHASLVKSTLTGSGPKYETIYTSNLTD
jgi:2'-5' RNA ligase